MNIVVDTEEAYREHFHAPPEVVVSAPGRVNLIGEHTDYNDGFVLPIALDRKVVVAAGAAAGEALHCHSVDLRASATLSSGAFSADLSPHWARYPAGAATLLRNEYALRQGVNLSIHGNIPIGAGLSSSAALSVASVAAIQRIALLPLSGREIAVLARRAEVEFAGVECGIMDQFVAVTGREGHALFLDCRSLASEQVPLPSGARFLICDTGVKRRLVRSAYNTRLAECREAVALLARMIPGLSSLRDIEPGRLASLEDRLPTIPHRRARHVVTENARVLDAVAAMKSGDCETLGRLMTASHESLRDDYEVSCPELNAFVASALALPGVYGARMTGAGFGGCGVCLVREEKAKEAASAIADRYAASVGVRPTVFAVNAGNGLMVTDRRGSGAASAHPAR